MIKYKLTKGITSIDFQYLEGDDPNTCVSAYKAQNADWVDVQPVEYEEVPETPAPSVPQDVRTWRIQAVLAIMGLADLALQKIEELPEPNKTVAKYAWSGGSSTERNSATVQYLQQQLGLTDEQVDNIFIQADNLTV